jgi:hypothetical protein
VFIIFRDFSFSLDKQKPIGGVAVLPVKEKKEKDEGANGELCFSAVKANEFLISLFFVRRQGSK